MDMGLGFLAAGDVEVASARRAGADEDCIPIVRQQRLEAVDALAAAELDAEIEDVVAFFVDDRLRQAKARDLRADHAAGLGILIDHHARIAERCEVARDRQRRWPAADQRDAFAVLMLDRPGKAAADVVLVVGGDALEAADRDRLFFHAHAPAGRLARAVARAAQNPGEHVGAPVDHVRVAVAARSDQPDVLGNRCVRGTGPLTIHDLVEIVRRRNVGIFHGLLCTHACRAALRTPREASVGRPSRCYLFDL